jgi:hypothetical protein
VDKSEIWWRERGLARVIRWKYLREGIAGSAIECGGFQIDYGFLVLQVVGGNAVADKPVHVRFSRPSGPVCVCVSWFIMCIHDHVVCDYLLFVPVQVMTLIDLPGITQYDVSGQDIHKLTSDMVSQLLFNLLSPFFRFQLHTPHTHQSLMKRCTTSRCTSISRMKI